MVNAVALMNVHQLPASGWELNFWRFDCDEAFGSKASVAGSMSYGQQVDLSLRYLSIDQVEAIVRVLKGSSCPDFGKSA